MKICALIAAKDEAVAICMTIDSIISAGVPKEDVYLVSDGSKDATVELALTRGINVLALEKNGGNRSRLPRVSSTSICWPTI